MNISMHYSEFLIRMKVLLSLVILTGLFFTSNGKAQEIYLAPGDSKVIDVYGDADTVFISSPAVADYEVISNKKIIVYAKKDGRADLQILNKEGEQTLKNTIIVDKLLASVQKEIARTIPDSQVSVQKTGNAYIINGTVATEEDRDRVYQIVGEGISAERITKTTNYVEGSNVSEWLEQITYRGIINKLQLPMTNQVNVKLSIVEVTKSFTDNIGVDWNSLDAAPGSFRFVKFNADTLSGIIRAISNDSVARVLAEPNLSVLSGETAEFLVGGEVPLVTNSLSGATVSYKEFGIKLNIGAKVNSSKRIRVSLQEEVSNINESYVSKAGDSFPALQTRRARTTVELADGESFLLGGLINSNEREELSKLPFIGDVPILGALFRNAKTQRMKSELVVIATVNLVKPLSIRDVVIPDFQRTSTEARFFNLDKISNSHNKKIARQFIEQGGFVK